MSRMLLRSVKKQGKCGSKFMYPLIKRDCHYLGLYGSHFAQEIQGNTAHAPYCHLSAVWLHHIFRYYLINGMVFGKKKLLNDKCVFWFFLLNLFETFLVRRIQRDIATNVKSLYVKYPLFLWGFNESWIFSKIFGKKAQIFNFTKILQVGAELFRADGQTDRQMDERTDGHADMTMVIVSFRNFANTPKSILLYFFTKSRHSVVV